MSKRSFERLPFGAKVAMAFAVSVLAAFVLCFIISLVAMRLDDPTKNLALYGEICFMLTMLFCGFLGAKLPSENRFLCGTSACGIMLLLVVGASIVFGGNSFLKELLLALMGTLFGVGGAFFGAKEPRRRKRR